MNSTGKPKKRLRAALTVMIVFVVLAGVAAGSMILLRRQLIGVLTTAASTTGTASIVRVTGSGTTGEWVAGSTGTARPLTGDESFRIGSITKTFVATVILQLVDEKLIKLDDPIDRYLPDLVPDGDAMTVRQILNHTSGLYDYMKGDGWSTNRWRGQDRYRDYTPRELLDEAFAHRPYFRPGQDFRYSNTNYIVAGMLIERVTGRSYGAEIHRRILTPLRLSSTVIPGSDAGLPEPALHATGELGDKASVEVTEQNPSLDWAAGEMISTTADLDRFFDALLGAELISARSLAQMQKTVPIGLGFEYGLGLERFDLPCGGTLWGHGGQLLGYLSYAYRRDDGRSVTLQVTSSTSDGFVPFLTIATATYCLN